MLLDILSLYGEHISIGENSVTSYVPRYTESLFAIHTNKLGQYCTVWPVSNAPSGITTSIYEANMCVLYCMSCPNCLFLLNRTVEPILYFMPSPCGSALYNRINNLSQNGLFLCPALKTFSCITAPIYGKNTVPLFQTLCNLGHARLLEATLSLFNRHVQATILIIFSPDRITFRTNRATRGL